MLQLDFWVCWPEGQELQIYCGSPDGGGAVVKAKVEGSIRPETKEISNSGRSLSVDITQKLLKA